MATPVDLVRLGEVVTTQDEARQRFQGKPLLVVAETQTGGRGRGGTRWRNADRSLAASLALDLSWPAPVRGRVSLVAGLAALEALPGSLGLKWPNDIVRREDKVGGILGEHSDGVAVIGLGVNLWWRESPDGVGSLYPEDPGDEEAPALAAAWGDSMVHRLAAGPEQWGREQYVEACVTLGQEIVWEPGGAGRAVDISDEGSLVVDTDRGTVVLDSGIVTGVRPAGGTLT
jgi:biotin-(acetyl-CoA carboxylase) ligase